MVNVWVVNVLQSDVVVVVDDGVDVVVYDILLPAVGWLWPSVDNDGDVAFPLPISSLPAQ